MSRQLALTVQRGEARDEPFKVGFQELHAVHDTCALSTNHIKYVRRAS